MKKDLLIPRDTDDDLYESDSDDISIRLKSSRDQVNPDSLSDEYLEALTESIEFYKENNDPIAIITTISHMFSGLRINDIRDRLVIYKNGRVYHPSREFVRKKIVGMYLDVQQRFVEKNPHVSVSPIYKDKNINPDICCHGPIGDEEYYDEEESYPSESGPLTEENPFKEEEII